MVLLVEPIGSEAAIGANGAFPKSVRLASGDYVVSWLDMIGSNETLVQLFNASGTPIGSAYSIGEAQHYHAMAPLTTGGFVVVYSTMSQAVARIFDAGGAPVGSAVPLGSIDYYSIHDVEVVGLAGGGFAASCRNGTTVMVKTFDAAGNPLLTLLPTAGSGAEAPQIAQLADGKLLLTWHEHDSVSPFINGYPDGYQTVGQLFAADGSALSAKFIVNQSQIGSHAQPEVAALTSGGFVVSWVANGFGGGIKGQIYDSAGSPVGGNFSVSTATNSQTHVDVAALPNGGFLVAWSDSSQQGSSADVLAQVFTDAGTRIGPIVRVSEQRFGNEVNPSIVILSQTEARIVYRADGNADPSGVLSRTIALPTLGTNGDDTMTGTDGSDRFVGLGGNDTLTGGAGDDWLDGGDGNDTLQGGTGDDTLDGGSGVDALSGGDGDDTLLLANRVGDNGILTALTGAGSTFDGGAGTDTLSVGGLIQFQGTLSSIERIVLQAPVLGPPTQPGTQAAARLEITLAQLATLPANAVFAGQGEIVVTVPQGASFDFSQFQVSPDISFTIVGASGGAPATVNWIGTDGADQFLVGSDTVIATGGGGEDVYVLPTNAERIDLTIADWTSGEDWLDFSALGSPSDEALSDFVSVSGNDLVFDGAGYGFPYRIVAVGAALSEDEGTIFAQGPLTLTGNAGNNLLFGSEFADTLRGGAGNDRIYTGGLAFNLFNGTFDAVYGEDGDDTIVFDRPLIAGTAGGGTFSGGDGFDTIELRSFGTSPAYGLGAAALSITGIERLHFASEAGRSILVTVSPTQLAAMGVTEIAGGDGTDVLLMGVTGGGTFTTPNLTMSNWNSSATPHVSAGDYISLIGSGNAAYVLNARDGLGSTQFLQGGGGNDTLNGSNGTDLLSYVGGTDALYGNGGNDVLVIANRTNAQGVATTFSGANSLFDGGDGFDMLSIGGVVNFAGTAVNLDAIYLQPAFSNPGSLAGQPAAHLSIDAAVLPAFGAMPTLYGTGTITVNLATDTPFSASGWIHAPGSSVTVQIVGTDGNDVMTGSNGNDVLLPGAGIDQVHGGDGDDTIILAHLLTFNETFKGDAGFDTIELRPAGPGPTTTTYQFNTHLSQFQVEHLHFASTEGNAILARITYQQAVSQSGGGQLTHVTGGLALDDLTIIAEVAGVYTMPELTFANWTSSISNPFVAGDYVRLSAAGPGNYTLYAREGLTVRQTLSGSGGNDMLYGSSVVDLLFGGAGADQLRGGGGRDYLYGEDGNDYIDGGSGADMMSGGTGNDTFFVDDADDLVIEASNGGYDTVYATVDYSLLSSEHIEVLAAGNSSSNLTLIGNDFANSIIGNDGANVLRGGGGDDTIRGNAGSDTLWGGSGTDIAQFGTARNAHGVFAYGGEVAVLTAGTHETDRLYEIETVQFSDGSLATSAIATFAALDYVASHRDLALGFGADGAAGFQHYINHGFFEGRAQDTFDELRYGASNSDLAAGLGTDRQALLEHYLTYGIVEGRAVDTFDTLLYGASNSDLAAGLGTDRQALLTHYLTYGVQEGRATSGFDVLLYGASNSDLAAGLGTNRQALLEHYLTHGIAEGRPTSGFDVLLYGASNSDLAAGLGTDRQALLEHYLTHGIAEGRPTSGFDTLLYGASNSDLAAGLGTDRQALLEHYLTHGIAEGRPTSGFDTLLYGASNSDLAAGLGADRQALLAHYLDYGIPEGRPTSGFDAYQYIASHSDLLQGLRTDAQAGTYHYLEHGIPEGRAVDTFDAAQYLANYADLRFWLGNDEHGATLHYITYGYDEGRTDDAIAM